MPLASVFPPRSARCTIRCFGPWPAVRKAAARPIRAIQEAAVEPFPRLNGRKARIPLVEDNVTNQQVALGVLRKLGLTADGAANGCEALESLRALPYDLVLMDVQMPEMEGPFRPTAMSKRFLLGSNRYRTRSIPCEMPHRRRRRAPRKVTRQQSVWSGNRPYPLPGNAGGPRASHPPSLR